MIALSPLQRVRLPPARVRSAYPGILPRLQLRLQLGDARILPRTAEKDTRGRETCAHMHRRVSASSAAGHSRKSLRRRPRLPPLLSSAHLLTVPQWRSTPAERAGVRPTRSAARRARRTHDEGPPARVDSRARGDSSRRATGRECGGVRRRRRSCSATSERVHSPMMRCDGLHLNRVREEGGEPSIDERRILHPPSSAHSITCTPSTIAYQTQYSGSRAHYASFCVVWCVPRLFCAHVGRVDGRKAVERPREARDPKPRGCRAPRR
jgi:hypothetical protein